MADSSTSDVKLAPPVPVEREERYFHKTFMDTLGRTAIKLHVTNVADEQHNKEMIVSILGGSIGV